ncbi:AAA family ATPase, partial [Glycomyces tenuis]
MNQYFVDRNTETAALRQFARSVATAVRPRGALIDGDSGIGKSALLADLVASRAELPVDLYIVRCLPRIGPTAALDAVANLFAQTEAKAQRRIRLRKRAAVSVSAGGQLLALVAQSIPHAGQLITSATGAVRATLDSGSMPFDSLAPFERALDLKVAEVLTERLRRRPSVVIVDDLHYCDERSLFVFDQLLRQDRCPRLGLIFARDDRHPAGKDFARLTDIWHRDGLIERRELFGLPPEAVTDLVSFWFPGAPPDLASELAHLTDGHPTFLTRTLESLDPTAPVLRLPESLRDLVAEQLNALPDGGGDLLVLAAIQGFWFDSATVAELSGLDRAAVRDQLHALAGASRLIEVAEPPDWARRDRADHYRFQHQALWEVIHGSQSDERRREGHERVALAALDRLA